MAGYRLLAASAGIAVALIATQAWADPPGGRGGGHEPRVREQRDLAPADHGGGDHAARDAERAARDALRATERVVQAGGGSGGGGRDKIDPAQAGDVGGKSSGGSPGGSSSVTATAAVENQSGSNSGSGGSGSGSGSSGSSGSGSSGSSGSGDGSGSNSGSGSSGSNSGSGSGSGDDTTTIASNGPGVTSLDEQGHTVRDRELVVVADDATLGARAQGLGFVILERDQLRTAGSMLFRLQAPAGMRSSDALALLQRTEPASAAGYNHIYFASGPDEVAKAAGTRPATRSARPTAPFAVLDGFSEAQFSGAQVQTFSPVKAGSAGHGETVTAIAVDSLAVMRRRPGKLMLANVVESYANGSSGASLVAIIRALDWASASGARVANLSFAGPDNPAMARTVERVQAAGLMIVAAVGNFGPAAPPAYPAAYPGVVGVTAVDHRDQPYALANRGGQVMFSSLGVDLSLQQSQPAISGTSFAAPVITAVMASLAADGDNLQAIEAAIALAHDLGPPGRDPIFGYGRIGAEDFRRAPPARLATITR